MIDPAKVFVVLDPSQPVPDGVVGSNAKRITVPDECGTIYCWKMVNPTFKQVDDTHNSYGDVHATGQTFVFHKLATVIFVVDPLHPSGSSTTTPAPQPAPAPSGPVGSVTPPTTALPVGVPYAMSDLAVQITFDDPSIPSRTYRAADGTYKGIIQGGFGIAQRKIALYDDANCFWVFFYADIVDDHLRVVLAFGDVKKKALAPMGGYTAVFLYNGQEIARGQVPLHYWGSEWSYLSRAYAPQRTPADIVAMKLFPPFVNIVGKGELAPVPAAPYAPMGHSNITSYEPQTGERGDIGPVTEITGHWMITGSGQDFASLIAWAEGTATIPVHMYDSATLGLWDWTNYPGKTNADLNMRTPASLMPSPPSGVNAWEDVYPVPEEAHMPSLLFIPYKVTGDPYYKEKLQCWGNFCAGRNTSHPRMFSSLQTRAWAWELRLFLEIYDVTLEAESGGLLGRAYWKAMLDDNRNDIIAKYVNASTGPAKWFAIGPPLQVAMWWQEDYFGTELALAVFRGYEEWRPVFEWKYQNAVARAFPERSGWPAGVLSNYRLLPYPPVGKLDPGCDGTGTFTFAESGASQQPTFTWLEGDWKGVFVDETHYQMYQPDGKLANQYTYALGAMYGNSNGSLYFILNGSGFKAGNTFTVTVRQPKTWAELAEANGLRATPDGTIDKTISGEYPQDFRAVHVIADYLGYLDAKAALDRWDAQIVANFPVRDRWSFARKAA